MVLSAFLYLRGWLRLRSVSVSAIPAWRAGSFLLGLFFSLGGGGLAPRSIRRGTADRAYDSASAAHDRRSSFDLAGRTVDAVVAWFATAIRAIRFSARCFVGRQVHDFGRMLSQPAFCWIAAAAALVGWHVPSVFTLALAIGIVACSGARMFPRIRASLLVARYSALAECPNMAAMVHPPLPFSRHPAMRHPLRISGVLRSCCLPGVPLHTKALRHFCSRGPGMRRGTDVDLRHDRLSAGRSNYRYSGCCRLGVPRRIS